jgi:hypothetical protein
MDSLDRMYRHLVRTIRSRFPQYLTQPFDVGELSSTVLPYRFHRRELGLETNEDYEITLTELLSGERDYLVVDGRMRDALRAELKSTNPDPSAFKAFTGTMISLSPTALRGLEAGPDDDATVIAARVSAPTAAASSGSESRISGPTSGAAATAAAQSAAPPTAARSSTPPASGGSQTTPRHAVSVPTARPAAARTSGPSDALTAVRPRPAASPGVATASETPSSQPAIAPKAVVPQPGERCRSCNEELPPGRAITFCPHCGENITTMHCPACGSELEFGWKFCPICGRPT